jgi:hypothetical protein
VEHELLIKARVPGFGFWVLGGFGVARVFCPFEGIVRLSLKFSLGAHVEPAFQLLNVEMRFFMLAEGSTLGISLAFCLESLCGARFLNGSDVQCAGKRRRAGYVLSLGARERMT